MVQKMCFRGVHNRIYEKGMGREEAGGQGDTKSLHKKCKSSSINFFLLSRLSIHLELW